MIERLRAWTPTPAGLRRAFLAALVMNTVIVVTGGAVRLTASGLGCPRVPRCTDDSLVVTREMGVHGLIEFGNRMLTFVLAAAVVTAVFAAWRAGRRDLLRLAGVLLLGIVAQALLGMVTVVTELNPGTVMAHFLLSMALIAVAALAYERSRGAPVSPILLVRREVHIGAQALVAVTAGVLVLGTTVTGTGPHSGDKQAQDRFPFDLAAVTQMHADLVFLLFGLVIGLLVALRATDAPHVTQRRVLAMLVVALSQGALGYLQYVTDLPVLLVGFHVLGACLVWIAALRVLLSTTRRVAEPVPLVSQGRSTGLVASNA